jgi:hypothetical protein
MPIITLISDFGTKDFSVAAVKARLYSLNLDLDLKLVDISHEIAPYNIIETAFILNAAYPNFPAKTIHLIGVDAEFSAYQKHLIVSLENQIFIGADNGQFSLLNPKGKIQKIIEINHPMSDTSIFPMKDVFCEIAVKISQQVPLEKLGKTIESVRDWKQTSPDFSSENELAGHVAYVDRFGNLITDITRKMFEEFVGIKKFLIRASSAKINKVYNKYDDFADFEQNETLRNKAGKSMAVFNSLDLLEIALYKSNPNHGGSASELLGLKEGDTIKVILD